MGSTISFYQDKNHKLSQISQTGPLCYKTNSVVKLRLQVDLLGQLSPVLLLQFGQQLQFIGTQVLRVCRGDGWRRQNGIVGGRVRAEHGAARRGWVLVHGRRGGRTLQLREGHPGGLSVWAAAGDRHGADSSVEKFRRFPLLVFLLVSERGRRLIS